MNFMPCTYQAQNGQGFLAQKGGDGRVPLDNRRRQLLEQRTRSADLVLGIRPEHLHVHPHPTPVTLWQGTAYAMEPLGPKTVVHVQVGRDIIQVIASPDYRPRVSEPQWIAFDLEFMHIFDGSSHSIIR
jgi:ABC-type sugar transport system ATPase subunit